MSRKQDESRCCDLLIIDRMSNSPMSPSFRATVGCFAFITLIFARVASSQVATASTLTSSPAQADAVSPEPAMTQGPPVSPEYRRLQYHLNLEARGVYADNIGLSSPKKISDY